MRCSAEQVAVVAGGVDGDDADKRYVGRQFMSKGFRMMFFTNWTPFKRRRGQNFALGAVYCGGGICNG